MTDTMTTFSTPMTEPDHQAPVTSELSSAANEATEPGGCLRESVAQAMKTYFHQLDGQPAQDVYQMVLGQVEAPLLEAVMRHTGDNQTRASEILGLNRGTLRKKLKQYDLL